jgi:23S rRNA (adenine2503-C2)-methyltransferase
MDSIHDAVAMAKRRQAWRIEPNDLRQLRKCFYKKQQTAAEALSNIPAPQRDLFGRDIAFHALKLCRRQDSRLDGASKLVFRTARGQLIESVILRIASGRTSLCVSSQVGCAARCAFCATGHMGIAVNLTSAEILDQVIQANQLLHPEGRRIRNVVFMGMGEPLHNEKEVYQALDVLLSPDCFDLSPAHVALSTVGIPAAMARCAERYPRLGLALSLHSACQERRERLIPLASRYPLTALRAAIEQVTTLQGRPPMIEYLLLDGLNDNPEDVQALRSFLAGLPVHVNLIPYNAIDQAPGLRGTPEPRRRAFAASLVEAGFPVTIRYSLGADIAAACGQLARREGGAGFQPAELFSKRSC